MRFEDLGITKEDLEGIEYEDDMGEDFDSMESKFTYLNQGSNSVVFNIEGYSDFVLKMVMYTEDPFIELMKLSDEEREDCSLPILHDKYESDVDYTYIYLIERCYDPKFTQEELQDFKYIPDRFSRVKSDRVKLLKSGCMRLLELYGDRINDDGDELSVLPTEELKWDWDLYESNVLMRKSGELVLVDPFCV